MRVNYRSLDLPLSIPFNLQHIVATSLILTQNPHNPTASVTQSNNNNTSSLFLLSRWWRVPYLSYIRYGTGVKFAKFLTKHASTSQARVLKNVIWRCYYITSTRLRSSVPHFRGPITVVAAVEWMDTILDPIQYRYCTPADDESPVVTLFGRSASITPAIRCVALCCINIHPRHSLIQAIFIPSPKHTTKCIVRKNTKP